MSPNLTLIDLNGEPESLRSLNAAFDSAPCPDRSISGTVGD
jgi:hypothetical protein